MFMGQSAPRSYLRRSFVVAGAIGILAYLVASGIEGERGLLAASRLRAENTAKSIELAKVEGDRDYLSKRVDALDPQHLDLDMLGEEARRVLFFSNGDEIVVTPAPAKPADKP